ncbi:MAG: hypothetical protein ACFFAS_14740 [Promethearchaeota archaeon]
MQQPKKKIRSRHKVNIKKESQKQKKLAQKKRKDGSLKQETKPTKERQKSVKEAEFDLRIERETKIYWYRAFTGVFGGFLLRIYGFVGWTLFLWMLGLMLLFPFMINYFLKYEFEKDIWTWKNVLKPGLGVFFFLFMFSSVFMSTIFDFLGIGFKITFTGIYL